MKKAFYIHGAFSAFKPDSEKVKGLKESFEVVGLSYSIEDPFEVTLKKMTNFCIDNEVDFVVGTSLGGLYASEISRVLGLPSIMINPCVEPQMSLSTIVGTQKNFTTGKDETLTKELIHGYPNMAATDRSCLIFLGMKDELINNEKTFNLYSKSSPIFKNENEDHYWEFFNENEKIKKHIALF